MKTAAVVALAATLSFVSAFGQQTREEAVKGMRKVEAKEMDPTYTKAAPVAQKLVDEALAKHPEVILIAIHAAPPGHKNLIVASNFGRIGKIGDEDDMRCINTKKPNLEVDKTGLHFEAEIPMMDQKGTVVGALGVVFNYKAGDDKKALQTIADQIQDEMKAELPKKSTLFGPA
jgi:iron complex outermembrane receptor protein